MSEEEIEVKDTKMHKLGVSIDDETWMRLWNHIKTTYPSPWRKMSEVVRKAIIEYLDRLEKENELQKGS